MTCDEDEHDDSCSKQVSLSTLVRLSQLDLRCHVVESSKFRMEVTTVLSFDMSGKTKVSNFDVEMLINKQVFRFQVSMRESFLMDMFESFKNLFHVESCNRLTEWT